MTNRVSDDPSLAMPNLPRQIADPIIIVHNVDGKQRYILDVLQIDPMLSDPRGCGIILSDLLDHMAAAYRHATGRDEKDIRAHILKVMRDEDRFKEKDPARGKLSGATWTPPKH